VGIKTHKLEHFILSFTFISDEFVELVVDKLKNARTIVEMQLSKLPSSWWIKNAMSALIRSFQIPLHWPRAQLRVTFHALAQQWNARSGGALKIC